MTPKLETVEVSLQVANLDSVRCYRLDDTALACVQLLGIDEGVLESKWPRWKARGIRRLFLLVSFSRGYVTEDARVTLSLKIYTLREQESVFMPCLTLLSLSFPISLSTHGCLAFGRRLPSLQSRSMGTRA